MTTYGEFIPEHLRPDFEFERGKRKDMTPDEVAALVKRLRSWLAQHEHVKDSTMVRWCPLFKDFDNGEPNVGDIRAVANALESLSPPAGMVTLPREQLEHWSEYWNRGTNQRAMIDALEHILGEIDVVLSAAREQGGKDE